MPLTVLLRCADIAATRRYYETVLAFHASASANDTLTVQAHGGKLVFTTQDLWNREPGLSGTLYFSVADVQAYYAQVKDQAAIAWPLQHMAYGSHEFGLIDCNGYLLAFQQQH